MDSYTEHSLKLLNLGELFVRLYQSGREAVKAGDTFTAGANLRLILDSAAMMYNLLLFNDDTRERFIEYFDTGKPTDKFNLYWYKDDEGKSKRQYLTNGFIRNLQPELDYLYKVLNDYSHPSKVYLDKIVKMDGDNLYIERTKDKGDITGVAQKVYAVWSLLYKKYLELVKSIKPKSDSYRIVYYSDTILERNDKEPVPIKVFKEQALKTALKKFFILRGCLFCSKSVCSNI